MSSAGKNRNSPRRAKPDRQALLASIDIFEESIVATRYTGRSKERRLVNAGDLTGMLGGLSAGQAQWLKLWPGVVAIGIDSQGRQRHLLVRPAKRTTIICELGRRRRRLTVHLPNLLAELVAEAGPSGSRWIELAAVYAFGGRAGGLKADTILYVPPLPNLYGDGKVCMGSIAMARLAKLSAQAAFESAFLQTPFTDHLLDSPLAARGRGKKWRNIVDALVQTGGRIPLRQLRRVKKFGEVVNL